jgi:hypothetical protein
MSMLTVPPRRSGSRGVFTGQPRASASSMRRAVCRRDFARIVSTPISLTIRSPGCAA